MLRKSFHEDPEIMASIELAKVWYLYKRKDMQKYERSLLKSIEYCSKHTINLATLGKLYLKQEKIKEGKQLIRKALNNVRLIYTDENIKNYNKFDIQEFLNEHYKQDLDI